MRNEDIEGSVEAIISRLDEYCSGASIQSFPPPSASKVFDDVIRKQKGSVRLASIFLLAYSTASSGWDFSSIPVGIRGKHGDKRLAAAFTERHVTLHFNITAFGENLGWKGNVRNVDLSNDPRFSKFLASIKKLSAKQREVLLDYAIYKCFESRAVPKPLPPLPSDWLSYARALQLCEALLAIPSEGHIQQFLVAGFLSIHRKRFGHSIETHHPHASDTFDGTSGDIEEFRESNLVAAYEVTVRDDWKNRLPDLQKKATEAGLQKYIVIASGVANDKSLSSASALLDFLEGMAIDLAVVDIKDFFNVFCAELSPKEMREAINSTYEYLLHPKLSGRNEFIDAFTFASQRWINAQQGGGGNG